MVLISDDNIDFCSTLADIVNSLGYNSKTIQDPQETLEFVGRNSHKIGILLLDIEFAPTANLTGIDVLEQVRRRFSSIPVVMISGKGTIETAVRATKLGALNFIEKSIVSKEIIKDVIGSAFRLTNRNIESREIMMFLAMNGIIGHSKAIIDIGDKIIRFGRTELNVLITGETGTGKKLTAMALHQASRRGKNSFITVDIPNIPRDLFQSELFGHVRGAFSGATENKKGLFHHANNGSIFLDEIGDLTLELQSSLLIPVEEKIIRKVGSSETENMNIRFVSATDRDLIKAMQESRFREQLFHRLRECGIHLPPLRDRREDIPEIIDFYVKRHNNEFDAQKYIPTGSIEFLQEQQWPGNIRELSSLIRVALQTSKNEEIEVAELNKLLSVQNFQNIYSISNSNSNNYSNNHNGDVHLSPNKSLKEDLAEADKKKIENTLETTNGNVSKAAAMLGISRETLHIKIRKYEIDASFYRKHKKID